MPPDDGEVVSLREFFERIIDERDKRYEARFISHEEAVELAHRNTMWLVGVTATLIIVVIELLFRIFR